MHYRLRSRLLTPPNIVKHYILSLMLALQYLLLVFDLHSAYLSPTLLFLKSRYVLSIMAFSNYSTAQHIRSDIASL